MVEAQQDDTIGSPISMSHYTQNIQSLLTIRFKILHMIFRSEFGVKNKTKEFCFFGYFYRMLGSGEEKKTYCWWKWMQTVLEVENLKPFSDTHSWMLLTHSCIALSLYLTSFHSHKAKSSTKNAQSVPFKTALTILLILMLKRTRDRMLPCRTPISCSCSSDRVEPTLTLK